jgi:hypothetical protein
MGEYDSSVRCPICGGEAELGRLYGGDPAALKWLPGSQSLFLGAWAFGSKGNEKGNEKDRHFLLSFACKLVCGKVP